MTLGSIDDDRLPRTEMAAFANVPVFSGSGNGFKLMGSARTDAVIDNGSAAPGSALADCAAGMNQLPVARARWFPTF